MTKEVRVPSFLLSLIPILFLVILMYLNVVYFGDSASYGPNQIALLLTAAITSVIALRLGFNWKQILEGMVKSVSSALGAIFILLVIGALTGSWMISGIVPAMIYYGLEILNPTIFLVAACLVSAVVALATGSSWSTTATIGIALIGIGQALQINPAVIAGAVISGAYFGDKMSPLSDTTNLAPAMAGTDLFTHIRYMVLTTAPSFIITLIIFIFWGLSIDTAVNTESSVELTKNLIESKFNISGWLFLVPALVIVFIIKKMPALPAIFIGTVLGSIFALIFQPNLVLEVGGVEGAAGYYKGLFTAFYTEISFITGNEEVDSLLSSGGMEGMLSTVWLIVCAMIFGGTMDKSGMLKVFANSIIQHVRSVGGLIASTAGTCLIFNLTASDQYISIVVPGRMFRQAYQEKDLAPENLSRTLEDTGTVTSVLIPWNTCGAYQAGILGIATGEYFMYCFFNLISPLMTIIFGVFQIKINRISDSDSSSNE